MSAIQALLVLDILFSVYFGMEVVVYLLGYSRPGQAFCVATAGWVICVLNAVALARWCIS
jgi:hypothetical protein